MTRIGLSLAPVLRPAVAFVHRASGYWAGDVAGERRSAAGGYEAFSQTGEIVVAHLAPDFELRQASSSLTRRRVSGARRFSDVLRELEESFEDFRADAEKFIEAPTGEIASSSDGARSGRG